MQQNGNDQSGGLPGTLDAAVVTAGRPAEAERCIASVASLTDAGIIVIVNGTDADTEERLAALRQKYPRITVHIEKERVPKSRARNLAVERSRADLLFFIDDDAFIESDIASLIREKFDRYPEAAVIGGPNITPDGSPLFARLAGYVLSSPFTAWRMRAKFRATRREGECTDAALTLCNLAVRRGALEKESLAFDERLHYNEENLLMRQLMAKGYRMVYVPQMCVRHERRKTVEAFARQVFESGKGRAKMTAIMPSSFSPSYGMPLLFSAYLVLVALLPAVPLLLAPLAAYTALDIAYAARIILRNKEKAAGFPVLLFLAPLAHLSYGLGLVAGIGDIFRGKKWS